MIPELGQFSLILAFAIAILLGVYPLLGAQWGRLGMMSTANPTPACTNSACTCA